MQLVFATNNTHKLQEARDIAGDGISIMSLKEIGCTEDIAETSDTIEGNALQKARYIYEHYGVDCFADDTGLFVDALDGAPGVMSARYAGTGHDAAANRAKLLGALGDTPQRSACFKTVVALIIDGAEHIFTGRVDGHITTHESGTSGFGYDALFAPTEAGGPTFAQMSEQAKNNISHRGRALRQMLHFLSARTKP